MLYFNTVVKLFNKNKIVIILMLFSIVSCKQSGGIAKEKASSVKKQEQSVQFLLDFFNKNAYQPKQATYYSEIDNEGRVVSSKVYNVALSRLIYGLSYASFIATTNLKKAKQAANFQINELIGQDSIGTYFISFYDMETGTIESSKNLDIWQQAYGLCGLSELYRNSPSQELLLSIHKYHDSFIKRFHDDVDGGFYGSFDRKGVVSGSKSLQSLIYPITAYMENLWIADYANRDKYEPYLKENLQIAFKKGWNKDLGWVNLKFNDQWVPCQHTAADSPCFNVTPGHNFQFASLFLRTKHWGFLTKKEQQIYGDFGLEVLGSTLKKHIFPKDDLSQGFYSELNPVTNEVIDFRKTWWQHCEALIALSLADTEFKKKAKNLEEFYFESFSDKVNGGEFFFLDQNNVPQVNELKGSIGKSTYHTVEMIRFLKKENDK